MLQWKQVLGWGQSVGLLPKENLDSLRSLLVTQAISQQSTCAIFYVYIYVKCICNYVDILYVVFSLCHTVVIWGHLLGDLQWW